MPSVRSTGKIMMTGVVVAAAIVALRVILEQAGAPNKANMVFGVVWLYFLLPICLALRIASSGETGPYKGLFKDVILFGVYTRLMVMVTYVAAYFLKWNAPRFRTDHGGNVGENVSLLKGVLFIPVVNAAIWVVSAAVIGMIIGGITLAIARRSSTRTAA
jgi:hypothetical protein